MNKIIKQFNKLNNNEQIYLLNIINEGIKSARELYLDSGKISNEDFNRLLELDPSETKKYLEWLCKQYIKGIDIEELERVILDFNNKVNKNLIKNKDINYYKDIDELKKEVIYAIDKSRTEEEKHIKKTQSNVILDNEHYFIVEPLTWEASKIYGKGTKWCTASEDTDAHWYGDVVNEKARIFYVRDKKLNIDNPEYKIAIYVPKYNHCGNKENINYRDIPCKLYNAIDISTDSNLKHTAWQFGININKISNIKYIDFNTKEGIIKWLDYMEIEKYSYTINDDLIIDIDGNVKISYKHLDKIPVQFGIVNGYFDCHNNNLISLKGSPRKCRNFICSYNLLKSLKGCPKECIDFYCDNNKLTKEYLSNYDFSFVKRYLDTDYVDINNKYK